MTVARGPERALEGRRRKYEAEVEQLVAAAFAVMRATGTASPTVADILAEAGLSYLGFGASVVEPSWGLLLSDLQRYIGVHPLSVIWPGLAITITVLALNLLGDGLRDALDPRSRRL